MIIVTVIIFCLLKFSFTTESRSFIHGNVKRPIHLTLLIYVKGFCTYCVYVHLKNLNFTLRKEKLKVKTKVLFISYYFLLIVLDLTSFFFGGGRRRNLLFILFELPAKLRNEMKYFIFPARSVPRILSIFLVQLSSLVYCRLFCI